SARTTLRAGSSAPTWRASARPAASRAASSAHCHVSAPDGRAVLEPPAATRLRLWRGCNSAAAGNLDQVSPAAVVRRLGAAVCGAALLAGCSQTVAGHGTVSALPSAGAPKASTTATTPATPTGSPAAPGTSGPEQLPITFAGCGSLFDSSAVPVPDALQGKITFGCGTIKVPLDYADPGGQQLSIELVKVHDTDNGTPLG